MDSLVNYKVAELLKINGFSERVNNYFSNNGNDTCFRRYKANYNSDYSVGRTCSRPTIWEAIMWLKEKHNTWIVVDVLGNEIDYPRWYYKLVDLTYFKSNLDWQLNWCYISYEKMIKDSFTNPSEAYQAAIEYFYERKQNESK